MADLKHISNEFFWQFFLMLAQDVTLTCKFPSDLIISVAHAYDRLSF